MTSTGIFTVAAKRLFLAGLLFGLLSSCTWQARPDCTPGARPLLMADAKVEVREPATWVTALDGAMLTVRCSY